MKINLEKLKMHSWFEDEEGKIYKRQLSACNFWEVVSRKNNKFRDCNHTFLKNLV